jgi:hypothetical protein
MSSDSSSLNRIINQKLIRTYAILPGLISEGMYQVTARVFVLVRTKEDMEIYRDFDNLPYMLAD